MFTIRKGTFETNSSSTHSMVICSQDEYDKWDKGELLASRWKDGFKTKDELIKELVKEYPEYFDENGNFISNDEYETLEDFFYAYNDDCWYNLEDWVGDLESAEDSYTTSNGDVVRVVCRYGYE